VQPRGTRALQEGSERQENATHLRQSLQSEGSTRGDQIDGEEERVAVCCCCGRGGRDHVAGGEAEVGEEAAQEADHAETGLRSKGSRVT
jgi:hypothetical protein